MQRVRLYSREMPVIAAEGLPFITGALEIEMHGSHYAQHTQQTEIKFKCDRNAAKVRASDLPLHLGSSLLEYFRTANQ